MRRRPGKTDWKRWCHFERSSYPSGDFECSQKVPSRIHVNSETLNPGMLMKQIYKLSKMTQVEVLKDAHVLIMHMVRILTFDLLPNSI